jgi:DNA-binding CsgD family transcriptional regulator
MDGVKHHIMAIFKKLGATNRSEAVAIALRRQLLKN